MSEPVGVHAMPPWADTRNLHVCSNCHMKPKPGERHGMLDGTTEDGEPLGFTCLDALDRVIYLPAAMHPIDPDAVDPWSAPRSEWPEPPF